jgi:hypothetical protein
LLRALPLLPQKALPRIRWQQLAHRKCTQEEKDLASDGTGLSHPGVGRSARAAKRFMDADVAMAMRGDSRIFGKAKTRKVRKIRKINKKIRKDEDR